ncbi:hypothetical protein QQ045_012710 [Rhodiola kirilowii]
MSSTSKISFSLVLALSLLIGLSSAGRVYNDLYMNADGELWTTSQNKANFLEKVLYAQQRLQNVDDTIEDYPDPGPNPKHTPPPHGA